MTNLFWVQVDDAASMAGPFGLRGVCDFLDALPPTAKRVAVTDEANHLVAPANLADALDEEGDQ